MLMQTVFSESFHEKNRTVSFVSSWERIVTACFWERYADRPQRASERKTSCSGSRRIFSNQNKLLNPRLVRTEWGVVAYGCAERWSLSALRGMQILEELLCCLHLQRKELLCASCAKMYGFSWKTLPSLFLMQAGMNLTLLPAVHRKRLPGVIEACRSICALLGVGRKLLLSSLMWITWN